MKTASILLAVVAVLGFVREAGADGGNGYEHQYLIRIGGQQFGIVDYVRYQDSERTKPEFLDAELSLGPLGIHNVPFTATQGLVGFGLILVLLVVVPMTVLTVRWKKKRAI